MTLQNERSILRRRAESVTSIIVCGNVSRGKWAMGEKAPCGQQDSRDAAAQTMVGDALKRAARTEAHSLENGTCIYTFVGLILVRQYSAP